MTNLQCAGCRIGNCSHSSGLDRRSHEQWCPEFSERVVSLKDALVKASEKNLRLSRQRNVYERAFMRQLAIECGHSSGVCDCAAQMAEIAVKAMDETK